MDILIIMSVSEPSATFTLSSLYQQLAWLPFAEPQGLWLPGGLKPERNREEDTGLGNSLSPLNPTLNEGNLRRVS